MISLPWARRFGFGRSVVVEKKVLEEKKGGKCGFSVSTVVVLIDRKSFNFYIRNVQD